MGISDLIASFLQDSLDTAEDGVLEVQRSELAQRFNCVPSQINYVMSGQQRGSGFGQSHPQQSGAVRRVGAGHGSDDPHRRGR